MERVCRMKILKTCQIVNIDMVSFSHIHLQKNKVEGIDMHTALKTNKTVQNINIDFIGFCAY